MTGFINLIQKRRSYRKFTNEQLSSDELNTILRAALMSPTSKGQRSWKFIVVADKTKINEISKAKENGSQFIKDAPLLIIVLGEPLKNDCWIEDCSIAAFAMQLQAEDIGLGSCWVQFRGRGLNNGRTSNNIIHEIIGIPDNLEVLCAIAIGHKTEERKTQDENKLKWENVIKD